VVISSRTPEGDPNRCPLCGHDCRLEPSLGTRDGPCPQCGHLLWFGERTALEGAVATLLNIVRMKFGPQSGEIESELTVLVKCTDPKQVFERALTATTVAELLSDTA
jgi:hypothetical protein